MTRIPRLIPVLLTFLSACDFDNFAPPDAKLEGRVVYDGQPVGVRQNAVFLELWQDGFELRNDVPVSVYQDGTFQAMLFEGTYQLVPRQNNGPWVNAPDTTEFDIADTKTVDIEVTPFFTVANEVIERNGERLSATANVSQIVEEARLEGVTLFLGETQFVDTRFHVAQVRLAAEEIADLTAPVVLEYDLSSFADERDYVFARIGVKAVGVPELVYTPVHEISLE